MEIRGICYIANKYQSTEKDFEKTGDSQYKKLRATGRIAWADKQKDSNGNEKKIYTNKSFVCFDSNTIDCLEACKNDALIIEGRLLSKEYIDKEGQQKKFEQVIINKASKHEWEQQVKEPEKVEVRQEEEELGDDIPF